ncbi:PREDICTED: uncharacterized protein LOC104811066 [Tarenaya hassleriana]|uniref:uncharacterized protein LOC104811066 n=1 Tax=Tarenaya hassleriana TaxID=28532 RepID=UPI00053C17BC|nr:PREDICTED: uncharacterized protein LOC104811066 [Tarenaya hassleriana]
MVGGALSVVGSSVMDSATSPCSCLDAHKTGQIRSSMKKKNLVRARNLELRGSFIDSSVGLRFSKRISVFSSNRRSSRKQQSKNKRLVVVSELAGQYEDSFDDVKAQILNYFTYKAVRTVLNQLYEMNPPSYTWFYNFLVVNKPTEIDGKRFLRSLGKERQELAERVMITRLHLYSKWIKKCDHGKIYQQISDENLELMRERLMETVIWPSDDTNTEKIN